MSKNPKVSVYEISTQVRVLDKTLIPQIVIDKEPLLLVAHVGVLRAGESKRGVRRLFAFHNQRGLPASEASWYGWVSDADWTLRRDECEVVAWLPVDALPKPKQAEIKNSEWGVLAVILLGNRLRLRDVQLDVSMSDEAHAQMHAELGVPEIGFMAELDKQYLIGLLEKRQVEQIFL